MVGASADDIIFDGRGGGTGAAPLIFRTHISVPTIPALACARRHLDAKTGRGGMFVITAWKRDVADLAGIRFAGAA